MKTIIAFILLIFLCSPAIAGWDGHRTSGHPSSSWGDHGHHRGGSSFDQGLLGGLLGGAIGGLFAPAPEPVPEAPRHLAPWSQEWYDSCDSTYKSFDAQTGYYNGYDGQRHFCVL